MAERGALEQPWVRHKLIRDLAKGDEKDAALARRYGVNRASLLEFKRRHAVDIEHVAAHLDDVFAGIVFADKANRIAALSQQAQDVLALLADPEAQLKAGVQRAEMERVAQTAWRAIAEEKGELPSRHTVVHGGQLDVTIGGVDVSALK